MMLTLTSGCVSAPEIEYYTLDMGPSGAVTGGLQVDAVTLRPGDAHSRDNILIRTSPTRITYYANHAWGAGLDQLTAEKLKAEFGQPQDPAALVEISGDILAFEQVDTPDGANARIKLDLDVKANPLTLGAGPVRFSKVYQTEQRAASRSPDAVVSALSQGLAEIAGELSGDIVARLHSGGTP